MIVIIKPESNKNSGCYNHAVACSCNTVIITHKSNIPSMQMLSSCPSIIVKREELYG